MRDARHLQLEIGAHRDFGVITLLGNVLGLEVWDKKAQPYYPVSPVEGDCVANLGNSVEQWANNKYISNVNCVVNRVTVDRYSVPFNCNGKPY